jgi:hypothetical protein
MKMRILLVSWVLLLIVCTPALAQITIGGMFEAQMDILPDVSLKEASLTLTFGISSWTISSTSTFGATGFTNQEFAIHGELGPFQLNGGMAFNPADPGPIVINFHEGCPTQSASVSLAPPEYKWSWFALDFTMFGFTLTGRLEHWAYPYIPKWADTYYEDYMWPCCEPEQAPSSYMLYLFSAKAPPFFLDLRFSDCCSGITFSDLTLGFDDLSLCCGVAFDLKFYFTKAGFQYVLFEVQNVPFICCGFALDFAVKFTVSGKEVSIKPKWVGVGQVCVQVYGDVEMEGASIIGIEVYGYKIRCDLAPCNYVEFLTVLAPEVVDEVEEIIGDVFEDTETEYAKFGICGKGCCGSEYTVDATVFFGPSGSLFGFTRVVVDMEVPLLANFSFTSSFTLPNAGAPEMSMGFIFRF